MDQKKRRNSILKKPPVTDDETTADITTKIKRRISFSGKKSVKEFLAGEEEATIWGTSYEESAECLQTNTTESTVVGVNDKRIVLRNRRVVVDTNRSSKRRSSKKVHVAANDKENIFIQMPQVEKEPPTNPAPAPAPAETLIKEDSPVKSELMVGKNHVQNVRAMKEPRDSMNACSSTFDFINYSGAINKTITIEQSVDVSLDENELQMFKFRVPVSAMDASPNLSLERDGSPNIFSCSILMSEEDMKMLKVMKAQMGGVMSADKSLKMIEASEKTVQTGGGGMELVEVAQVQTATINVSSRITSDEVLKQKSQRKTITRTVEMEVVSGKDENSRLLETKNLKRKTITAATKMDESTLWPENSGKSYTANMNTVLMDLNSPMRKKPMHKQLDKPMDISAAVTVEQEGPIRRQTIHFEAAAIDEYLQDEVFTNVSACVRKNDRQTIHFDENQIQEDTIRQENDGPPPISEDDHLPMELSLVDVEVRVDIPQIDEVTGTGKKRQSIHVPVDILEESPKTGMNAKGFGGQVRSGRPHTQRESIYMAADIVEDSPKQTKSSQSRRQSVHTPTDIIEESPKPTKRSEVNEFKTKDRQTIYNTDMIEEVSVQLKPSAACEPSGGPLNDVKARAATRRTTTAAVDMAFDPPVSLKQEVNGFESHQSIYTPLDMMEEKSIYIPSDMVEDSPKPKKTEENSRTREVYSFRGLNEDQKSVCASKSKKINENHENFAGQSSANVMQDRKSIYTPSDMIEDSPEATENQHALPHNRKSIYSPTEIVEDSILQTNHTPGLKIRVQDRKSIYTASDMDEEQPEQTKTSEIPRNHEVHARNSVYIPSDMIEDSPKVSKPTEVTRRPAVQGVSNDRKTIYMPTDIVDDSFNGWETGKTAPQKRQSIYTSVDMIEDSPKASHSTKVLQRQVTVFNDSRVREKSCHTICAPNDILEDSQLEEFKSKAEKMQTTCIREDLVVDLGKFARNSSSTTLSYLQGNSLLKAASRQTICAPTEMLEDSPPKARDLCVSQSMKFATDPISKTSTQKMDCPKSPESKATNRKTVCLPTDIVEDSPTTKVRQRHSIYDSVDIMDESPKKSKLPESTKPQAMASVSKVVVKHMTLQQGIMGDNAAMRILKNKQTKPNVAEPSQINESAMDMSGLDNVPSPTNRPNYYQLNEQMIKGEMGAFANEPKNKMSLFDRLDMNATEEPRFDSFLKKPNAMPEYLMQPKKSSFKDYTLELTRNTFDGQRLDLSSRMHSKVETRDPEKKVETMNISVQMSPVHVAKTGVNKVDSKRQTIHFHHANEMDVSTSVPPQEQVKSVAKRQTIHFHEHLDRDKPTTQTFPSQPKIAFEKNLRTIHFDENNQMEESRHVSNQKAMENVQDLSTMDVSIQDEAPKSEVSCNARRDQENLTLRMSHVVPESITRTANRQTICAPADIFEATRDQVHNDTMDLSTSICAKASESIFTQRSQVEPAVIGRQRRTIHCNEDLELDQSSADCSSLPHVDHLSKQLAEKSTVTQSAHGQQRLSAIPTRIAGRKTIHLNQDLELDEDKSEKPTADLRKPSARQTIYFQQNDGMDESLMEPQSDVKTNDEFPCKEDVSKVLPKPRRMTTFDDLPVDVDESTEKITTRKSSFSRTLNFDEISRAAIKLQAIEDKDSPLFRYSNKLRRQESTAEIDRSLAEYLKAEAAATLCQSSPQDMSLDVVEQSPQSVYYDAVEEHADRERFMVEHQERVHMLEESGMQPLQKSASRRDIEECVSDDAVAKQEEVEHEQSNVSFELRGLQANRMNHEFFDNEVKSMSPTREQIELREHARGRRQTILDPEPMMDQSDTETMTPEKPLAAKGELSQQSRKTIHFTNENAVDESFFDENLSKPAAQSQVQNNRQTIFFNESQNSIDDIDTTLTQNKTDNRTKTQTIGRSKAAQSMKEILRESNMLFTQSVLKPHLFENKRSTVYFDAKDMSMDTVTTSEKPKEDDNIECTPTKANKSRIPQLIGSAKKLQSMKKSMEFIQQKLPNLSSSTQAKDEDEVSPQLEKIEQVKAAEILHDEADFSCQPKQFHESFQTVEIPRRFVDIEPKQLQESFDTVEIPRRATTFQRNDTLYLCQNEVDITNISQKSNFRFEDVPITISDVSTYFAQKPPPSAKHTTYSPNTTEALCNLDMNKFADETQLPKSSDSEDTAYNFDKFKKRYVELTCESINSSVSNEDIEKTHLSLVNTLDEHESEVVREPCSELPQPNIPQPLETTKFSSSVCRKCKRHKQNVSQNDTTISSFVLAPLPEYKMDLAALRELGNKPRIFEVAKIWRQNLRESDSFNVSDGRSAIDLEDDDTMDNFIASLDNERRMAVQHRQRKEFKHQSNFVHTVRKKIQSKKSNWILSDLLLTQNILKFTHSRIRTFAICISFTQKDPRGVEVEFNEMRVVPNVLHSRSWTAFDYALHYQLLVELPFDLSTLCPKSENLFQLLEHVESVTQDVLKTGRDMLYLVLSSPASLIRDSSGGIYIRKYTRARTAQNEVKHTEFQIEVRNMKRLSYESITQPPLYEFDEKIQLLPTGQDFLRIFLADPLRYMKS